MASATSSTTSILDLSDGILQKVFQRLNLEDLGVAADVCNRFRQNAKERFQSTSPKVQKLYFEKDHVHNAKILRNFGAYVNAILLKCEYEPSSSYQKGMLELLGMHCSGTLVQLQLHAFCLTEEFALMMWPVLLGLRELCLLQCEPCELFLKMLATCAPELRKLEFLLSRRTARFDGLHQSFEKLEMISLSHIRGVKNGDVEEFLERNPQLKHIQLIQCENLDDTLFQSIATHTPSIGTVRFDANSPLNHCNAKYCGQMKNLSSLEILATSKYAAAFVTSAVCEIGANQIPLKHLCLIHIDLEGKAAQFVEGISKLKHLQTLNLCHVKGLDWINIHGFCKHLTNLSKLWLFKTHLVLDADNVLETIRNAERLEMLSIDGPWQSSETEQTFIDAEMYLKMVETVSQRREGTHLVLHVESGRYKHQMPQIPKKLIRKYQNILTLEF